MKRILFISQYFYPEEFRGNDIAFFLASKGYHLTVVAATPNYPQGRYYDGYGIIKRRKEIIKGVEIIRVPTIPRGKGNKLGLFLNYLSYPITASIYTLLICLFRKKFDCIFVQQLSPVTVILPAILYKKIKKIPLYSWVLDLWPESLSSVTNINNRSIIGFFNYIAKLEYLNSDKILISSNGFRKSIMEKGNFEDKIVYFPNWAEDLFLKNEISNIDKLPSFPDGFKVMFAGNLGDAQGFENILLAAKELNEFENIKFIIVGNGRKRFWIEDFIKRESLEKTVSVLGRFPQEMMPAFFERADVLLVSLKDKPIFNLTVPAKLQAYMATGKPILAMLNGEGANIVKEANCGIAVNAEDTSGLVTAVLELYKTDSDKLKCLGKNGQEYYFHHFSKELILNKLITIINAEDIT